MTRAEIEYEAHSLKGELCKRIYADDLSDGRFLKMLKAFAIRIHNAAIAAASEIAEAQGENTCTAQNCCGPNHFVDRDFVDLMIDVVGKGEEK